MEEVVTTREVVKLDVVVRTLVVVELVVVGRTDVVVEVVVVGRTLVVVLEVLTAVVVVVVVVGRGSLVGTSPLRTHPVLSVNTFGQVICLNVKFGLSAFKNQSKRQ